MREFLKTLKIMFRCFDLFSYKAYSPFSEPLNPELSVFMVAAAAAVMYKQGDKYRRAAGERERASLREREGEGREGGRRRRSRI